LGVSLPKKYAHDTQGKNKRACNRKDQDA